MYVTPFSRCLNQLFPLVLLVLHWIQSGCGEKFSCYTCGYVRTSIPEANYECINAPWDFKVGLKTIACESTQYCITKTLYTPDYKEIRSSQRSCGRPENYDCGMNCCQKSIHNVACQHVCQGELCNDKNEAVRIRNDTHNTPPGTGGPGAAARFVLDKFLIVVFLLVVAIIN